MALDQQDEQEDGRGGDHREGAGAAPVGALGAGETGDHDRQGDGVRAGDFLVIDIPKDEKE